MAKFGRFTKKSIPILAAQWYKNGDHPEDYTKPVGGFTNGGRGYEEFSPEYQRERDWEGQVVRYYRTPDDSGERLCEHCGVRMHEHGWIDTLEGGHIVCPGDWIITGIKGERYPCKPDVFEETYVPVEEGGDGVLGKLREARALLLDERDAGRNSRALSIALTEVDTAILWREEDLRLKREPVNEASL